MGVVIVLRVVGGGVRRWWFGYWWGFWGVVWRVGGGGRVSGARAGGMAGSRVRDCAGVGWGTSQGR